MSISNRLRNKIKQAKKYEESGDREQAPEAYREVARLMKAFAKKAVSKDAENRRMEKAKSFLNLAKKIESGEHEVGDSGSEPKPAMDSLPDEYRQMVNSLKFSSDITLEEIGGLEEAKSDLLLTYGIQLAKKPQNVSVEGWKNVLLFGPPGTGKTLLAAAVSNHLNAAFFNVKASDLLSKYFGETPKLISALFDVARGEADQGFSVIFIDEFDALSQKRGSRAETNAERRVVSTILAELDGLSEKGEDEAVLNIGATNAPWDLDNAILSRFQKRIFIPLPDYRARKDIFRLNLEGNGIPVEADHDRLAENTEGFSGRDISRLCTEAVSTMVKEKNNDIPEVIGEGINAISGYELDVEPLTYRDFERALEEMDVALEDAKELNERYRNFSNSGQ
ncbi:MAG: AAA family ATPase [Candidatus Acetothermia bacterium]